MSGRALELIGSAGPGGRRRDGQEWLAWLQTKLDYQWRVGEWDGEAWLFTGDLASARTAAWPCRTTGCLTATRRTSGRCDGCRRARVSTGLSWTDFDAAPPPRATRPLSRGRCAVPGCEGDLHSNGLCFRHGRVWNTDRGEPITAFIARARPLSRGGQCRVAGCDREIVVGRGLCWFHNQRLGRQRTITTLSAAELAAWVAAEAPRLGMHQFSLAGLAELLRVL